MSTRHKILHFLYPALRLFNTVKKDIRISGHPPLSSVYELKVILNSGEEVYLAAFRGRKLLLVNIASGCGYTRQLEGLNELSGKYDHIQVIAFPSNDFRGQEPLSDNQIEEFCRINYKVDFPIARKTTVIKSTEQNEVFNWLTSAELNGWNDESPKWNFSKYLVNEKGFLIAVTGPATDPLSKEFELLVK